MQALRTAWRRSSRSVRDLRVDWTPAVSDRRMPLAVADTTDGEDTNINARNPLKAAFHLRDRQRE